MKLLTKDLLILPGLYATDGVPLEQKLAAVKFFDPTGRGTWFAFEGNAILRDNSEVPLNAVKNLGDVAEVTFFGWVVSPLGGDCDELGYFSLNELQAVKGRFGLGIERDIHFTPKTLTEALR